LIGSLCLCFYNRRCMIQAISITMVLAILASHHLSLLEFLIWGHIFCMILGSWFLISRDSNCRFFSFLWSDIKFDWSLVGRFNEVMSTFLFPKHLSFGSFVWVLGDRWLWDVSIQAYLRRWNIVFKGSTVLFACFRISRCGLSRRIL
jgi:hypothetical protein